MKVNRSQDVTSGTTVAGAAVTATAAIDAAHLSVTRGHTQVLHDISLQVPRGAITGLLGPSGCGKSTLMRAIVGVQNGVSGTINVLGEPAGAADLRRRIGYATQAPSVYGDLTVRENLAFWTTLVGASRQRIDEVLAIVDMTSLADRIVATLSGGERSRASIAVALLPDPELLVLDEPTVGLDPVLRRDLWNTFRELADGHGATLLISSHVMEEADRCDCLLLLRDGHLLAQTTPAELRTETGEQQLEAAFLKLIEQTDSAAGAGAGARRGKGSATDTDTDTDIGATPT
ncbi:MAG: ABC transporter ATP-binding protein [Thermoleophilia bacterium]|nr:ABC transporter ATP-binding protein [Thermoleophilia bacterium]